MRGVDAVRVSAGERMPGDRRGRAVGNGGTSRSRRPGGKKTVQHVDLCRPPSAPPGATPLTTTWLQSTAESFTHTASKISSCPKLHSRAALCGERGAGEESLVSTPCPPTPSGPHGPLPWRGGLVLLSAFAWTVPSSGMSFLASMPSARGRQGVRELLELRPVRSVSPKASPTPLLAQTRAFYSARLTPHTPHLKPMPQAARTLLDIAQTVLPSGL